jgi:phosphate butyryltransferase
MITRLEQVVDAIREYPVQRLAVAAAQSATVLEAVRDAQAADIASPLLVGDEAAIRRIADETAFDLTDVPIIHEPDEAVAAKRAALEVREGRADVLMKGHVHTDDFLRGLLDRETGLRTDVLMSHVFILDAVGQIGRLLFVTDAAMNIAPDLVAKAQIVLNAVYLARLFGNERPRVCVLAAVELVNPNMPATLDAAALATMNRRGQFPTCAVDGPFGLDNAVSTLAAEIKGIEGPCAGLGDILLVPDIEAGNIMVKTFSFLAGGRVAGVLIGAAAPVVLTSRADTAESKLLSIATAVFVADITRDKKLKIGKVHY